MHPIDPPPPPPMVCTLQYSVWPSLCCYFRIITGTMIIILYSQWELGFQESVGYHSKYETQYFASLAGAKI